MSKQFLGVIAIVILIFVGIFCAYGQQIKKPWVAAALQIACASQHVEGQE